MKQERLPLFGFSLILLRFAFGVTWYRPSQNDELQFYWPGECDRCHVMAHTVEESSSCNCEGESRAYKPGFMTQNNHERECLLNSFPQIHLRSNSKSHLRWNNAISQNQSYVQVLRRALGGRRLYWFGDSLSDQFRLFLDYRAEELGLGKHYLPYGDHLLPGVGRNRGPAWPQSMKADTRLNLTRWEVWEKELQGGILKKIAMHPIGNVVIYNIGIHVAGHKYRRGVNRNQTKAAVVYRESIKHLFGFLRKASSVQTGLKKNVAVFAETAAQHFRAEEGDYCLMPLSETREAELQQIEKREWGKIISPTGRRPNKAKGERYVHGDYPCVPSDESTVLWRNRIAQDELHAFPEVYRLPLANITLPLFDMHIGFNRYLSTGGPDW